MVTLILVLYIECDFAAYQSLATKAKEGWRSRIKVVGCCKTLVRMKGVTEARRRSALQVKSVLKFVKRRHGRLQNRVEYFYFAPKRTLMHTRVERIRRPAQSSIYTITSNLLMCTNYKYIEAVQERFVAQAQTVHTHMV